MHKHESEQRLQCSHTSPWLWINNLNSAFQTTVIDSAGVRWDWVPRRDCWPPSWWHWKHVRLDRCWEVILWSQKSWCQGAWECLLVRWGVFQPCPPWVTTAPLHACSPSLRPLSPPPFMSVQKTDSQGRIISLCWDCSILFKGKFSAHISTRLQVDVPCWVITGRHSLWDIFPRSLSSSSQKSHLMLSLGWGPTCASSTTARRVYIFFFFYLLQFTTSLKVRRKIILIFFLFLFENSIYVFKIHKCILIVSALLLSPRSSFPSIMLEYSWGHLRQ